MLGEVINHKEIMKKQFKKEFIMANENEGNFQMARKCHICNKLNS